MCNCYVRTVFMPEVAARGGGVRYVTLPLLSDADYHLSDWFVLGRTNPSDAR